MRTAILAALFALAVCACKDKPTPAGVSASASAALTAFAAPATSGGAVLPKPEKLDVAALKASFKCGKSAGTPCEVLNEYTDCIAFNPITKSGDGRWMGHGYLVKDGAFIEEITLLRSKAIAQAQAGEGALPVKIAIDRIPDERGGEKSNAERAIKAFERGDVPLPTNTAIRYVKERQEWSDAPALAAEGNQIYVATGSGAYLCGRSDQRLVLVRRASAQSHVGDGVYAILWPVTW